MEVGSFPENEFRIMIVKMIQDLRKRMEAKIEKMQEMFNKDMFRRIKEETPGKIKQQTNRDEQYNK